MARCGCEGTTCGCKVVGDGGIIVTGSGTATNPYRVSGSLGLQVVDTASINMTLLGTGSQSDPWKLSADFAGNLDDLLDVDTSGGVDGYVLARQSDGTYALVPPATVAPGAIATGTSLEGDGSGGSPLVLRLAANSGLELAAGGVRLDPYTVTTEADLDSLYGSLPAGSIVADDDGTGLWVKTTSGWASLIEDTGTITTIPGYITEASGWDVDSFKIRRRNGIVQMHALVTMTTSHSTGIANGNFGNVTIAQLVPPELRPVMYAGLNSGGTWGPMVGAGIGPSGNILLGSILPGVTYVAGTQLELDGTWIGA